MPRKGNRDETEFEDLSSYSSTREYQKGRKGRGFFSPARVVILLVCVLLILLGAVMIYISTDILSGLTTTAITKDPAELGITSAAMASGEAVNVALFGVDARDNTFTGLSDAIMVVSADMKHRKVKMVSVLRDSKVLIDGKTLTGETINWETKINEAYKHGGPELAIRTLNLNFGLDIQDYVTVNFADMAVIVDAFGGVDVELSAEEVRELNRNLWNLSQEVLAQMEKDRAEDASQERQYPVISQEDYIPDTSGGVDISGGEYAGGVYHLNGNQAVSYGRIRAVGNDYARVDRQQIILSLLVQRLAGMGIAEYPDFIRKLLPYCETSLDLGDIMGMAPVLTGGFTIETVKVPDIRWETDLFDGMGEDQIYYLVYNLSPAAQRINSFLYEEDSSYWEMYGNTGERAVGNGTAE